MEHGTSAGVRLRALGKGLVPVFEEHEARLERGYSLEEWSAMAEMEKALVIAARRTHIAIQNLQTEAEIKKAEQEAKRKR